MSEKISKRDFEVEEIGTTGLKVYAGNVYEEFLQALEWPKGNKIYREMSDNDPVIGAMLFAIEMLIRGVKWRVEPASESPEDVELAEFIESCMHDMEKPWSEVISDVITFIPFGFSVHEIVYKKRMGPKNPNRKFKSKFNDGKWGWRKLPIRAQETINQWLYDDDHNLVGVRQDLIDGGSVDIPEHRFLLFRTNSRKDNPEGRSALRNAYRPWYMKKFIEELEGIGIERDLAGLPIAYVPSRIMSPNATDDEVNLYNRVKRVVENVRQNEQAGVVFPSDADERGNKLYEFQLLSSSGKKQFNTNEIISRYNSTIAQTVLADFILIGHKGVGSFALSSDKTKLFAMAIGAWLDSISEIFNSKAIPLLLEANGVDVDVMPRIRYSDIEKRSLDEISQYVERLTRTGNILPDEGLENHLRDLGDLPKRTEDSKLNPTFEVKNEINDEFEGQSNVEQPEEPMEEPTDGNEDE